jgi:hypothetical protein
VYKVSEGFVEGLGVGKPGGVHVLGGWRWEMGDVEVGGGKWERGDGRWEVWQWVGGWQGWQVRFPSSEVMFDFFSVLCSLLVSWLLFALLLLSFLFFSFPFFSFLFFS